MHEFANGADEMQTRYPRQGITNPQQGISTKHLPVCKAPYAPAAWVCTYVCVLWRDGGCTCERREQPHRPVQD